MRVEVPGNDCEFAGDLGGGVEAGAGEGGEGVQVYVIEGFS